MTLFAASDLKPTSRPPDRDAHPRSRIPTGVPRLADGSTQRRHRAVAQRWISLLDAIRRSAASRLELLSGRNGGDRVPCPWARLVACDGDCRCGGAGTVTVGFLRDHYDHLAAEIAALVRLCPAPRRSS